MSNEVISNEAVSEVEQVEVEVEQTVEYLEENMEMARYYSDYVEKDLKNVLYNAHEYKDTESDCDGCTHEGELQCMRCYFRKSGCIDNVIVSSRNALDWLDKLKSHL